jgi:uncharacterized protein
MRERLTQFVQQLRAGGLRISIAETLDAMAAVERAGVEPGVLREALAATLVKDELDRSGFDDTFDAFFAAPPRAPGARSSKRERQGGDPGASAGQPSGAGSGVGSSRPQAEPSPPPDAPVARATSSTTRSAKREPARPVRPLARRDQVARAGAGERPVTEREARAARVVEPRQQAHTADQRATTKAAGARADRREVLRKPLDALSPGELEEAAELARELGRRFAARASRRERRRRVGRIDVRRTIRRSLGHGGAMIVLQRRGRRPGKPRLVVLCDVSGSVARASELLLSILAAAETAFRGVSRFVFVDRLVAVAFESGHILPEGGLDLWARSDFGSVLCDAEASDAVRLDRSTVLLVLGDARNNRRPPRADVWKRLAARTRAVVWVVPEPRERWNTGDSALAAYAPACHLVLEATSLQGLVRAVRVGYRFAR